MYEILTQIIVNRSAGIDQNGILHYELTFRIIARKVFLPAQLAIQTRSIMSDIALFWLIQRHVNY